MGSETIITISDIHMSDGEPYSWFKGPYPGYLKGMLENIAGRTDVNELLLLGDFFDLWLYPLDVTALTFDEVLAQWKDSVIAALTKCLDADMKVYYLNGNHDMTVTAAQVESIAASNGNHVQYITTPDYSRLHDHRLHVEHGHSVDMFNARPDDLDNSVNDLPLGYYITRLVATSNEPQTTWRKFKDIVQRQIEECSTMVESEEGRLLVEAIIDGLMADVFFKTGKRLTHDSEFLFPSPFPNATIGQVKGKYDRLLDEWKKRWPGHVEDCMTVCLEKDGLDWYAKHLFTLLGSKAEVAVMGHTHYGKCKVYQRAHGTGTYGNDGCWCDNPEGSIPSYIELVVNPTTIDVKLTSGNT